MGELVDLLDSIEKSRNRIETAQEAERLGVLYRRAAAHYSLIRKDPIRRRQVEEIRQLLVRAHGHVYRPPRARLWPRCLHFFARGFPQAVSRHGAELAISALTLFLGCMLGYTATALDPDLYYAIVPMEETRSPTAAVETLQESLLSGRESSASERSNFSGFLWQHNVRVGLFAFALGVLAGIPTFLLTLYNGLILGAMSAVFVEAKLGTPWFAWLAGHGVTELTALVFCSAGGLALGRAVLWPGRLSRRDSLLEAGRTSTGLAMGTVLMLLIAALLEGFFRQSSASTITRFGVAAATGVLWLAYFLIGARLKADRSA